MEPKPRQALGAPCPGTDPASLRLITVAVLAGLVISVVVVSRHSQPPGAPANPVRGGEQALVGRPMAGIPQAMSGGTGHARPARAGRPGVPALRLLGHAAHASQSMSYQGVEVLEGWSQAGPVTSIVRVWHHPGLVTLTEAVTPVPGWPGAARHILPTSSLGGQTLAGAAMLAMSPRLVRLLAANYRVAPAGWGQVAGRPARVVTARWAGGGLAARFWLDKATMLVLRRQTYGPRGQVMSDAALTQLRLGSAGRGPALAATARPWSDSLGPARLTALRARGWPLPGPLPGSLELVGAREDRTPSGPVLDLDYSDGLSMVSVFLQRGHLPGRLTGWSEVTLRDCRVYTDDTDGQSIAWSARGYVYTLVAAAPPQTVGKVVAALPHDGGAGLLERLARGMHRFASWFTPSGW